MLENVAINILACAINTLLYISHIFFFNIAPLDIRETHVKNLNEINIVLNNVSDGDVNSKNAGRSRDCRIYDPEENNRTSKVLSHLVVHSTLSLLQLQFTICALA